MLTMNRRSTVLLALTVFATLLFAGCSQDHHVYKSTTLQPVQVSIVSFVTGEELWSKRIPVGQQIRLDFSRKGNAVEWIGSPEVPADSFKWQMYNLYTKASMGGARMKGGKKLDSGKVDLPGEAIGIVYAVLDQEDASLTAAN